MKYASIKAFNLSFAHFEPPSSPRNAFEAGHFRKSNRIRNSSGMEPRSNDSSSFSCQSLYGHVSESSQPGSGHDDGKLSSSLCPPAETSNLRKSMAFRQPMRSSTSFHSEENGQLSSPSRKTPRATEETAFQDSSSRGVIPADGHGQLRTSSSTTNIGAIDRVDHFYGGGATEDSLKSTGANDTLAPSTIVGDGDGVTCIEDLTDSSDAAVMSMLAEFTEMARCTAVQNEELKRELTEERRRVAHTNRKLDQCNSTCAELRESLALAQDTVVRLREHEMKWAESTASEMSLRAEVCALKDERAMALGDAAALKKRCEALQQENNELGERLAAVAEEKRQVEIRARRLLRSDRYRNF